MRIKILADVGEGITLPINYNHLLTSVIYRFLAESNPEYASFLHDEGYGVDHRRFKLFTFSQLMAERRRITGDRIRFGSTLTWLVSSPVETFLSHFADTLLTEGRLTIGGHRLQIRDVTIPRVPALPIGDVVPVSLPDCHDHDTRTRRQAGNALLPPGRSGVFCSCPSEPDSQTRGRPWSPSIRRRIYLGIR